MKTKHILTALALPAMFAACTADDIVSENNGLQQDQRAKLSKDFVLNVNNEVESRYAVEGTTGLKFTFEEGDLIGANLIDAFTPGEDDPADWDIVNYISPALPFECKNGTWVSAGQLGIGNYLFTNPYNPEDKNRASAKYELPVVVHYDSNNPNAHIEGYNKAVAATVLREGDMMANISLKNLYTYPKIRINFDKDLEVTKVTKVILTKLNKTIGTGEDAVKNEFIYKGAFYHEAVAEMFNPESLEAYLKVNKKKTEEDYWNQFQTSNFIIDTPQEKEAAEGYFELKTTPYFIYEMDEKVSSNSIEVRFMLPSIADLTDVEPEDRIMMVVCTDQGDYEIELTDIDSYQWSNTTLAAKKVAALWRNTSNTLKTIKLTSNHTATDNYFVDNIVSTAADWNALVDKYGDLKRYSAEYKAEQGLGDDSDAEELVVTILDDDFALTADLEMPEVAEFVIKTEVGVEGAVTLKNIKMDGANLVVKKGATLTTDPTLVAGTVKVEKGGNLLFAAEYDENEELVAYDDITTVVNEGTVAVPAGVIAQFNLNNAKDAVVNVGTETRAAADAVANIYGTNNGIINNYSIINVVEKIKVGETTENKTFTNEAPAELGENEGYEWDVETLAWDGAPTINNYGTFNAKGETINEGLFVNSGVLTSNFVGNASFTNQTATGQGVDENEKSKEYKGTLVVNKKAETYIDYNKAVIELSEIKPEKFTIHYAKEAADYKKTNVWGEIKYTLNDKANNTVTLAGSPVTHLTTNVGINLTNTYSYVDSESKTQVCKLTELIVNGGELKIAKTTKDAENKDVYAARVETLTINSGEVIIDGEINSVDNVTIKAGAELGIPVGAKLAVAALGNITTDPADTVNELEAGLLEVNGSLFLTGTKSTSGYCGTNVSGKNIVLHKGVQLECVKYDFAEENAEAEAAALQAKYDNAVDQWWKDITENVAWIPTYYNYNPYDVNVFAGLLKNWYDAETDGTRTPMAVALFKEFGFVNATSGAEEATYTALDAEEKLEAIAAKLTDNANFTSAIASKVLTLADTETNKALTNLKAEFIGANSKKEAILKNITISRNEETIYESKEEALTENVYKVLAAYGEKNSVNVAKYVNIYQFKTDLATAFSNSTFTNAAGTFDADYAYVWDDCDLDKVVAVMAKVTYEDWKSLGLTTQTNVDNFYSLAGVKEFLRLAYVKGGTTGAAGAAKTVSDTYYDASAEWQYSNEQVKLLAGNKYDIDVELP